jgi:hypothetical protein
VRRYAQFRQRPGRHLPHSYREGKEVTVNPIMTPFILLYFWLGVTGAAVITGAIARIFSTQ